MLQWYATFLFLCAELLVCSVLICPMPSKVKKFLLNGVVRVTSVPVIRTSLRVACVLIFLLFLDSVRDHSKRRAEMDAHRSGDHGHIDAHHECETRLKMFYSQRNLYLTGFSLFLLLLLWRLMQYLASLHTAEASNTALARQAENASAQLLSVTEERDALAEQVSPKKVAAKKTASSSSSASLKKMDDAVELNKDDGSDDEATAPPPVVKSPVDKKND
jgi:B-cell receptor-associated protein 31